MPKHIRFDDYKIHELIGDHDGLKIDREVRWIELTRVKQANALNVELLNEVTDAIEAVPEKVLFISSLGNKFSAGLDRYDLSNKKKKPLDSLIRLYTVLAKHPSPIACLVARGATAGGVGLALCGDAVVMNCNAWFALPGAKVYRPLARVLFPLVQARRSIDEDEFERWYGRTITAGELLSNRHIDAIDHSDFDTDCTVKLMQKAVDVLKDKRYLFRSDIPDRLEQRDYDDLSVRKEVADEQIKKHGKKLLDPESLTLRWLIENLTPKSWSWLAGIFVGILTFGFSIGQSKIYQDYIAPLLEP